MHVALMEEIRNTCRIFSNIFPFQSPYDVKTVAAWPKSGKGCASYVQKHAKKNNHICEDDDALISWTVLHEPT
jgi:hypothetical protein